jgi:hypothetical protein
LQIVRSLSQDNFESHEDGINILKYLLHYSPVITQDLWSLYALLIQA